MSMHFALFSFLYNGYSVGILYRNSKAAVISKDYSTCCKRHKIRHHETALLHPHRFLSHFSFVIFFHFSLPFNLAFSLPLSLL